MTNGHSLRHKKALYTAGVSYPQNTVLFLFQRAFGYAGRVNALPLHRGKASPLIHVTAARPSGESIDQDGNTNQADLFICQLFQRN